jgi:hypothetical protein
MSAVLEKTQFSFDDFTSIFELNKFGVIRNGALIVGTELQILFFF